MTAFYSSSSGFCTNHCSVVREGCFDLQDSFSGPLPKFIANQEVFGVRVHGRDCACFGAKRFMSALPLREDFREKVLQQKLKLSFAVAYGVVKARGDWGRNTRAFRSLVLASLPCGQTALHHSCKFPPCVFLTSRQSARKIGRWALVAAEPCLA